MSLLKKINKFINFSIQRNFDEGIDIDATIKAKKEALAKRDAGETETPVEETKVEETVVAEPDSVEKVRQEVLTPVDAPKMELKTKSALDRQKAELAELKSQVNEKKEEIAQTEDDIKKGEKETKDAEAIVEAEKVESGKETPEEVAVTKETTPESTPETGGEAATVAAAEAKEKADEANNAEEVTEATEKSETENDDEYAKIAGIDAKESEEDSGEESNEATKELKEESEVKDYDGAKVADASGKSHTIVKRADGYYIKGTNSKVLDAEGKPTAKYQTLGNALINGQSVNDYVNSKGGWAKYNKELKSKSNG